MAHCHTCQLITRRDQGRAPLWDNIHRTATWDVAHAYGTVLPGWLVLVARRHMTSLDQMNDAEAQALGGLMRKVSKALQQVTACQKTYVVQFAEHKDHPHVHFHVIPRMADLPPEHRGPHIFSYLGVPQGACVSEARMNAIAKQISACLKTA